MPRMPIQSLSALVGPRPATGHARAPKAPYTDHDNYEAFRRGVQDTFERAVWVPSGEFGSARRPLFTTDLTPDGLWAAYLDYAPAGERQNRNCRSCESFVRRFGGLVVIEDDGSLRSAVWPSAAPPAYQAAASVLKDLVEEVAQVDGVFVASDATLGTPNTCNGWTHLSVDVPAANRYRPTALKSSDQRAAELGEDYGMVQRALADFDLATVAKAVSLLKGEALYRSEKVLGVAEWFHRLHVDVNKARRGGSKVRNNLVWRAVATAPTGYAHIRSSMIGTLLEDLQAGKTFEAVKRAFAEKMNPTQYQRPTAAPTQGQINAAERAMATLRAEGALDRRFATLDDVECLWRPRPVTAPVAPRVGLFAHLDAPANAREPLDSIAPPVTMTWAKFRDSVLGSAEEIAFLVPAANANYCAHVTATNKYAPNMLQWGNTCSHYLYMGGSTPANWGLEPGQWHRVSGVVLRPWLWSNAGGDYSHQGAGVTFVLQGAWDRQYVRGAGMFPELLKVDYREIRHTLEAHFKQAIVRGHIGANLACGITFTTTQGQPNARYSNIRFRVTANGIRQQYIIDRWD